MYPADDLMLLTDPPKMSKSSRLHPWALSSLINHCFNMPACFFCFLHLQTVHWTRHTHTHIHTKSGWQDMTKFGHVQTKHLLLPSKPLNCGRCHSKWRGFVDSVVHYQTISHVQQLILVATWSCPTWVLYLRLSPTSFEHDAHVIYPADDLMLLTDPSKMSKWSSLRPWALSSLIIHCFNMPACFFCFSHMQMLDLTFDESHLKWWLKPPYVPEYRNLARIWKPATPFLMRIEEGKDHAGFNSGESSKKLPN